MIWAIHHLLKKFFASCEIFKIISDDGISECWTRWKSKGTKPKGTGQKGPAKRDQPKGTKTQKGPWPKGTMAKRDQGTKGTMAKRDQGTKGTKTQKGPWAF